MNTIDALLTHLFIDSFSLCGLHLKSLGIHCFDDYSMCLLNQNDFLWNRLSGLSWIILPQFLNIMYCFYRGSIRFFHVVDLRLFFSFYRTGINFIYIVALYCSLFMSSRANQNTTTEGIKHHFKAFRRMWALQMSFTSTSGQQPTGNLTARCF